MTEHLSSDDDRPRLGAECTCLAVRRAARLITQGYDEALAEVRLTIGQFSLLAHVFRRPGVTAASLGDQLDLEPSSLTRALRPLIRDGLLVLEPDAQDGRLRRVSLTDAGEARFGQARACWRRAQADVDRALGTEAAEALRRSLEEASRALKAAR